MTILRGLVTAALVVVALALQVSLFPHLAWHGVVPDLVLLVVVGAALVRGPAFGAGLGFLAGLALDLAPPADHVAGRWALALVVVGYLAGRIRESAAPEQRPGLGALVLSAGFASFVGVSVYALSGLLLGEGAASITDTVVVILAAVVWDVVLAPFVLLPVTALMQRVRPPQVAF